VTEAHTEVLSTVQHSVKTMTTRGTDRQGARPAGREIASGDEVTVTNEYVESCHSVAETHQNESILPRSREISCFEKVNRDANLFCSYQPENTQPE